MEQAHEGFVEWNQTGMVNRYGWMQARMLGSTSSELESEVGDWVFIKSLVGQSNQIVSPNKSFIVAVQSGLRQDF